MRRVGWFPGGRLSAVVVLASAAIVGCDSSSSRESERTTPGGGTLAYIQSVAGETPEPITDVFVVHADGSGKRRVTRDQIDAYWLGWSPDGRRLVLATNPYRGGNVILSMNPNGHARRQLTPRGDWATPIWSPDGRKIFYSVLDRRADGAHKGIYSMSVDGKEKRKLTSKDDHLLSWSPDRRRVAFERIAHLEESEVRSELWAMNQDGTRKQKLYSRKSDSSFSVSPDWRKLAFARYRPAPGAFDLYVMSLDGTGARRVTLGTVNDCCAKWSPDSRTIAFSRESRRECYPCAEEGMWLVNVDGTGATKLVDGSGAGAVWSPNGKLIAFCCISVVTPDGRGGRVLVGARAEIRNWVWNPALR